MQGNEWMDSRHLVQRESCQDLLLREGSVESWGGVDVTSWDHPKASLGWRTGFSTVSRGCYQETSVLCHLWVRGLSSWPCASLHRAV